VDTLVIRGLPVDDGVNAWLEIASMVAEASELTPRHR
jgi:hypothetical protein